MDVTPSSNLHKKNNNNLQPTHWFQHERKNLLLTKQSTTYESSMSLEIPGSKTLKAASLHVVQRTQSTLPLRTAPVSTYSVAGHRPVAPIAGSCWWLSCLFWVPDMGIIPIRIPFHGECPRIENHPPEPLVDCSPRHKIHISMKKKWLHIFWLSTRLFKATNVTTYLGHPSDF